MAGKPTNKPTGPVTDWLRLPGSARNYYNKQTGQTISRRQFDKAYGSLAKGGYTSYEKKAKAYQPDLVVFRPARGRKSRLAQSYEKVDLRKEGPKANKKNYRNYKIAFTKDETQNIFIIKKAIADLKANRKIQGAAIGLYGYDTRDFGRELTPYLISITPKERIDANEIVDLAAQKSEENKSYAVYYALTIHPIYKPEFIKQPSPEETARARAVYNAKRRKRRANKAKRNKKTKKSKR